MGHPAVDLYVAPEKGTKKSMRYVMGIDLGGTAINYTVMDEK